MLVFALLLTLAAPASAGTVKYSADCSYRYYCTHDVTYTAAPGERNDVTVARLLRERGRLRITVEIRDADEGVIGFRTELQRM